LTNLFLLELPSVRSCQGQEDLPIQAICNKLEYHEVHGTGLDAI